MSGTFQPVAEDLKLCSLMRASHQQSGIPALRKAINANWIFQLLIRDNYAIPVCFRGSFFYEAIEWNYYVIAGNFTDEHRRAGTANQNRRQHSASYTRESAKFNKFFPIHL
jgi:hypothetical protein